MEPQYPPSVLIEPCQEPAVVKVDTVGALMDSYLEWKKSFHSCAAKINAVRLWVDTSKKPAQK